MAARLRDGRSRIGLASHAQRSVAPHAAQRHSSARGLLLGQRHLDAGLGLMDLNPVQIKRGAEHDLDKARLVGEVLAVQN